MRLVERQIRPELASRPARLGEVHERPRQGSPRARVCRDDADEEARHQRARTRRRGMSASAVAAMSPTQLGSGTGSLRTEYMICGFAVPAQCSQTVMMLPLGSIAP